MDIKSANQSTKTITLTSVIRGEENVIKLWDFIGRWRKEFFIVIDPYTHDLCQAIYTPRNFDVEVTYERTGEDLFTLTVIGTGMTPVFRFLTYLALIGNTSHSLILQTQTGTKVYWNTAGAPAIQDVTCVGETINLLKYTGIAYFEQLSKIVRRMLLKF